MNLIHQRFIFCLIFLSPLLLFGKLEPDSLYQRALSQLKEAEKAQGDFKKQKELATQAEKDFTFLGQDSLLFEAKMLLAKAAYYTRDSSEFEQKISEVLSNAIKRKDTADIVKTYNTWGTFYFSQSNAPEGIRMFQVPHRQRYYAETALEESMFNLGALIDVGLGYTMNLDTVHAYVNQLQILARKYPDPSVQVVSRFKLAGLFLRAGNHEASLDILREGYPYLGQVENKGFLHYFYRTLIDNFVNLGVEDSVSYYLNVLEEAVSYAPDDPRICYTVLSRSRMMVNMGDYEHLSDDFDACFDNAMASIEKSGKASVQNLGVLHVKAQVLRNRKDWKAFDPLLQTLIEFAKRAQSNEYLAKAYELRYHGLAERGMTDAAMAALLSFKEYDDKLSAYTFSQSQTLIKNQLNLELAEEENKRLQAENLNQKLRLRQDQSLISLFILGLLFLVLLISYLVHLGRIRNRQRDELQRLVGERTAQVEAANVALIGKNEELQASNSELERFAFIASHDLKTPLHNMIRFAGLLRKKLSPISDTDINTHLNFIEGEGKRMNTLIEDVLEYSKLNRQFEEENIRPILLGQLLNELSGSISGYVTERRAKIVYDYSLPEILWNYTAIFVLFKNLVENGIKYNQSAQPEVRIYGRESEEDYTLFVADNGIGIEEEFFDKIFEMFARLHNQKEYEGSGLGLASCKKIVDDFGGKIGLSSIPGEGTTFRIDIPRHLLTAQVRAV